MKLGSLYLAFGNKEALYREALESYARKGLAQIQTTLDEAPSVGEGICLILERYIQASISANYSSCFLIKTQLELAAEGGELHDFAAAKLGEVEAPYQSYLEKEFGEAQSRQRAISLMLHILGMRIYGYQPGAAERMRQGLRQGLPWLPWEKVDNVPRLSDIDEPGTRIAGSTFTYQTCVLNP